MWLLPAHIVIAQDEQWAPHKERSEASGAPQIQSEAAPHMITGICDVP